MDSADMECQKYIHIAYELERVFKGIALEIVTDTAEMNQKLKKRQI